MIANLTSVELLRLAAEARFDENALALRLGISERQLDRIQQKVFGRAPENWLRETRLMIAKGVLGEEGSVKLAAARLGFKQPSHFSREFKRRFGMSPRAYCLSLPN